MSFVADRSFVADTSFVADRSFVADMSFAADTSFAANVWGPHFWFVLHTMALAYPGWPNEVVKKKYYDFIQNLPLFLPNPAIGDQFSRLLDKYPVTPYLDSQPAFVRWMHFIHNRVNVLLNRREIPMDESMAAYYAHYAPKTVITAERRLWRKQVAFICAVISVLLLSGVLYRGR